MHFITNGYKCFSKTNSTDPRQRVPLSGYVKDTSYNAPLNLITMTVRLFSLRIVGDI